MKEKPILFSAPMVRAILDGSKTQTRRIVSPKRGLLKRVIESFAGRPMVGLCPHGKVGDLLWVRESFLTCYQGQEKYQIVYTADGQRAGFSYSSNATDEQMDWLESSMNVHGESGRPSIHMPRWASRILLEVTDVRVQRVQEISEEDALAEGIDTEGEPYNRAEHALLGGSNITPGGPARFAFNELWDSINRKRGHSWETNPWTWAISFRRIRP